MTEQESVEINDIDSGSSLSKDAWIRLRKNRPAIVGLIILMIFLELIKQEK